jgi:hypothetical protein
MSIRAVTPGMIRALVPMPIRQLPWRMRWIRTTSAYVRAPISTSARLVFWSIAECFMRRLKFTEGPFHFITMPNNFCGLWTYVAQPELLRFVDSRLKFGDVFVDVGANVGLYSAHASRAVGPNGV